MLVIKVELWPRGFESAKRELARFTITNDGTGTKEIGNYNVRYKDREGRIEGWKRLDRPVLDLVKKALTSLNKR